MRSYFNGATSGTNGTSLTTTTTSAIFVTRTTTSPLPSGKKYIDVQLLTRDHLYLAVDVKCKIRDVYFCVCAHLGLQDDARIFGMAIFVDGEYRFVDLNEKLSKCATQKNWSKASGWGTDLVGNPSVILYLRVHTYVEFVKLINCPVTLQHYYLQLRENARIQWEPSWIREERCFETAALALQADYGDFNAQKHATGYFRPDFYFPLWVINGRGMDFVARHMPTMHQDLQGLDVQEAKVRFCREVSRPPCPVNMHLYSLRKSKNDTQDNVYLGVTARSLEFFEQKPSGVRDHIISFLWSRIAKVAFERRKFTVCGLDGRKFVFFTSSDEKSRYLLLFCRSVHQNVMSLQPDIVEARKREFQERKQFRESYIYSDSNDLEFIREHGNLPISFHNYNFPTTASTLNLQSHTLISGQRVSLVSDASSNTTSGIVSDRQHNHDDSENENVLASFDDDLDCDICESSQLLTSSSYLSRLRSSANDMATANDFETTRQIGDAGNVGPDVDEDDIERPCNIIGPSSDRTMTALSDDGQSIGTTSTTEKLEDLATDVDSTTCHDNNNRKLSYASGGTAEPKSTTTNPSEQRTTATDVERADEENRLLELAGDAESKIHRELSALLIAKSLDNVNNDDDSTTKRLKNKTNDKTMKTGSIRSQMSIAELRNKTLNGFNSSNSNAVSAAADLPVLNSFNLNLTASSEILSSTNSSKQKQQHEKRNSSTSSSNGRLMKSLATQTNGSYLSCFKTKDSEEQTDEKPPQPCVVVVNGKENNSSDEQEEQEQKMSNDENEEKAFEDVRNNLLTTSPPPKMGVSSLAVVDRKTTPPSTNFYLPSFPPPTFQSYSLSNLPSSINGSAEDGDEEIDDPPNYEQAMRQKAERQQQQTSSSTNRRWPTISGFDLQDLAAAHLQLQQQFQQQSTPTQCHLQQAQSEPGLTLATTFERQMAPPPPVRFEQQINNNVNFYGTNGLVGNNNNGFSLSTNHLSALQNYYNVPLQQQQQITSNNNNNRNVVLRHQAAPSTATCSCQILHHHNGIYVKHPASNNNNNYRNVCVVRNNSSNNNNNFLMPTRLYPAVNRVQSMQHETAVAGQIRRQIWYEEKQRRRLTTGFPVQQQQRTLTNNNNYHERKKLHRHSSDTQESSSLMSINHHNHYHHKHYCSTCHEDHQTEKFDLAQLKNMIRSQGIDLPMIRALCDDRTLLEDTRDRSSTHPPHPAPSDDLNNNNNNNVIVRRRLRKPPPLDFNANEQRPQSWHESSFMNNVDYCATTTTPIVDAPPNGYYTPARHYVNQQQTPLQSPLYSNNNSTTTNDKQQATTTYYPFFVAPPTSPMRFAASTPNLFADETLPPPPPYPVQRDQQREQQAQNNNNLFYPNHFQLMQHNFYEQAIR